MTRLNRSVCGFYITAKCKMACKMKFFSDTGNPKKPFKINGRGSRVRTRDLRFWSPFKFVVYKQ